MDILSTTLLEKNREGQDDDTIEDKNGNKFKRTSMRLRQDIFWSMKALAASKKMNLTELCHESFLNTLTENKCIIKNS